MTTEENNAEHPTAAPEPTQTTASEMPTPAATAQAIPSSTSPPPTTATPAHAAPVSPTSPSSATATATPIQTMPSPGIDATPTSTQPLEPPILPPQDSETPQDGPNPRLASLSAIFPDFDSTLLESVLDSVDGNEERAADILLGMSDPNYVSQVEPTQRQPQLSQTELDEQLAQRLMLEEQQRSNAWRASPRDRSATTQATPTSPGQSGDTMDKFLDSVDKFAETSKNTLTNLFQKVKAKVNEFDSNRSSGSASQGNRPPQQQQQQWQGQSQAYYMPPEQPQPQAPAAPAAPQGYDLSSPTPAAPRPSEPNLQLPPQRVTPTTTPPPSNIDPSKIGMLPKRPVSLRGPQTPQRKDSGASDEENELDYVENPFEEGRHR